MRKNLFILTIALFGLATSSFAQGYACYGNGKVWIHKVGESPVQVNSNGQHACFSADGKLVFFNRSGDIFAVKNDGTGEQKIGTTQTGSGATFCAYRPEPQSVLVRQGAEFFKIDVATKTSTLIVKGSSSGLYGEMAISSDGKRMAARLGSPAAMEIKADKTGTWSNQLGGCSASISPDGSTVTRNNGSHTGMFLHDFTNLSSTKTISNTAGGTWDNQRFAVNSNDHIAVLFDNGVGTNKGKKIGVHQVSTNKTTVVGNVSGGDAQYPDFWLGELPNPGTTAIRTTSTTAAFHPGFSFSKQGVLTFSPATSGSYTIKFINARGAVIRSFAGNGSNAQQIDLSGTKGLIIVKMQVNNTSVIQKIIR